MKNKLLLIAVSIVALIGISSCSSIEGPASKDTGSENAEELSRTIAQVEVDLTTLDVQINQTNASLQALIQPGQNDLERAYKVFSSDVESMMKTADSFFVNSDLRNEQSVAYFEQWRTQGNAYKDDKVQALSEARLAEMRTFNTDIVTNSAGLKGDLKSYVETISEIRTYFSTDLTPKGVEAIRPTAQAAINDGAALIVSGAELYTANVAFREEMITGEAK